MPGRTDHKPGAGRGDSEPGGSSVAILKTLSIAVWVFVPAMLILLVLFGVVRDWLRSRRRRRWQVIDLAERRAMQEVSEIQELER